MNTTATPTEEHLEGVKGLYPKGALGHLLTIDESLISDSQHDAMARIIFDEIVEVLDFNALMPLLEDVMGLEG